MRTRRPADSHRARGVNINHALAAIMITAGTLAGLGAMLLTHKQPPAARASLKQACPSGSLTTNEARQPAYTLRPGFLPGQEFSELQAELLRRRPVMLPQHLEQGYNAVNVNFNLEGMRQLADSDSEDFPVAPLAHSFVARLRLPRASAWSLNVVFSQPRGVQRAGRSGPQDAHIDNLGLRAGGHFCSLASYQTSVLYLSVPQDMVGGNLSILHPPSFTQTAAVIAPEENLLVSFRGDQAHRVEEFDSASMRVSVTLEQYLVPSSVYWATVELEAKRLRY